MWLAVKVLPKQIHQRQANLHLELHSLSHPEALAEVKKAKLEGERQQGRKNDVGMPKEMPTLLGQETLVTVERGAPSRQVWRNNGMKVS
ncbi:hypothetical protein E1301_Tti016851 [Triplophysa tibetana]|uniref:Uncharacterized protein n=1 Tax=Triplophysa tibetana TaxID=1572043 RepID=A0A5A9N8L7_9TELE|nr:hypothetical protein E1301_Tti016851 [Triplophysa tibetana]